ncbi:MAG TPA: GNAT family N-acetyltransferase [Anaerolineales bacterium]|nr:GNAT family N-acetyltransferase [Anaerolineales bacterium]
MMVSAENDPRRAGTIWMLDLHEPARQIVPLVAADFRRVSPDLLPALVSMMQPGNALQILKRFENERRCYAAWVGDTLISYGWVSFREESIGELNLRLKLLPGEAYIWDCETLPAWRQRHLYSALLTYILGELRSEGFCRVWIGADLENKISQRGIERAGFHHVADLSVERVLAMRQVWVQGLPGVREDIVAEARRAFLGDRDKVWLKASSTA